MDQLKRRVKFPITLKLVLVISSILLFTISTLATSIYLKNKDILQKRIFSDLSLLAKSKSGQITELLEIELERALLIAARAAIKRGLTEVQTQGYASQKTIDELLLALDILKNTLPSLTQLDITDSNGKVIVSTSPSEAGKNYSTEPWFQKSKEKPSFLRIYKADSQILYDISCPVLDLKREKVIGVIKTTLKADRLFDLLADRGGLGESGEWVLGWRVGPDLLFLNPLRHNPKAAFSLKIPIASNFANPMEYATGKKSGIIVDLDYSGHEVLAAYNYIPITDWGFVAKIDTEEAFAPIVTLLQQTIFFGLLIFLVSLLIVYFFAKKISGPIKKLHEATEAIVAGQPNVHVDIRTHDEIGQLADAFNQMVSRRVVEDLKKDNEQLKKVDQLKSQFVSHVSHEFKSPLCVIKDSISLVLEGVAGEITAKQKEMLSVTKKHTDRLIRLVNDLLDLSKIEAGRMRLNKEKTDIAALVNGILKDYEIEFSKKQLVFTKEIAPDTGLLSADQDKLSEVIINLLDNAIKYSPVGGEISVKLTGDQSAVRFEISDSGREIAKEYQEKIFDKFERITADKEKGTGLGLPISKDIVNLHQGKMWVESPLWRDQPVGQQGSKFIVVLPKDLP